jgi:hypothetical protein
MSVTMSWSQAQSSSSLDAEAVEAASNTPLPLRSPPSQAVQFVWIGAHARH